MTRYDLITELTNKCKLVKNKDYDYNKIVQSGQLVDTHFDYNRGFYDVHIYYLHLHNNHICRVWFGTSDDGDFGSGTICKTEDKAKELVEKVANRFSDIISCPDLNTLNKMFQDLGVYFYNE